MLDIRKNNISKLLNDLADEISVPESKYEDAISRYEAVGNWLGGSGSPLESYKPIIFSQGSFALGTAVKPLSGDEYDIDTVCLLKIDKYAISQKMLKHLVGDRLKEHGTYCNMLDPKEGGEDVGL